ncbi:Hypothetical predicted protein, partial [Pelobates cultripes]
DSSEDNRKAKRRSKSELGGPPPATELPVDCKLRVQQSERLPDGGIRRRDPREPQRSKEGPRTRKKKKKVVAEAPQHEGYQTKPESPGGQYRANAKQRKPARKKKETNRHRRSDPKCVCVW